MSGRRGTVRAAWDRTSGVHSASSFGVVSGAAGVPFGMLPGAAFRGSMSVMSETVQKLSKRIEELQGAARKARLEAMQLAAKLLTTSNSELAGAPTLFFRSSLRQASARFVQTDRDDRRI